MEKSRQPSTWRRVGVLLLTHVAVATFAGYVCGVTGYLAGFSRGHKVAEIVDGAMAVAILEYLDQGKTKFVRSYSESDVDSALSGYAAYLEEYDTPFDPPWLSIEFVHKPMAKVVEYRTTHPTLATAKIVRDAVARDLQKATKTLNSRGLRDVEE